MFSITPLSDAPSSVRPREYPHKPYIVRNYYRVIGLHLRRWVYHLHSNVHGGLQQSMYFETESV